MAGEEDAAQKTSALDAAPINDDHGPTSADVRAAQAAFVVPEGYKRSRIPSLNDAAKSPMYANGVRVELIQQPTTAAASSGKKKGKVEGRWYCMVTKACREARVSVKVSNKSTSSATDHLCNKHGIKSTAHRHCFVF